MPTDAAWTTWVANQPALFAVLLFGMAALGRVIVVLWRRNEAHGDEAVRLVREVMQVTAANTAAMQAHTAAVKELTDALRSRR